MFTHMNENINLIVQIYTLDSLDNINADDINKKTSIK